MADSSSATSPSRPRLSAATTKYMLKRTLAEFLRDGGMDQAAKLTYYMVLSIAPTLLALFSLVTLLLQGIKDEIAALIEEAVSSGAEGSGTNMGSAVDSTLDAVMGSTTGGTIALIIGIATALWSASAYIKAFGRAANTIYEVPEGRGALRMTGTMLALTVALIVGILVVLISILLNQSIVEGLLGPIAATLGTQDTLTFLTESFLPLWAWLKWPVILVFAFALISLLYWGAPNLERPYRFISPGGVFAILGIALAAVGLSVYMSTIAGYSSYGAIGGLMAVLFALWVVNLVIVLGAEVDAEFERARELESGKPAEESLALPLRDSSGVEKAEAKHQALVDRGRDIRLRNLHHDGSAYTAEGARLTPRHGVPVVPDDGEAEAEAEQSTGSAESPGSPERAETATGRFRRRSRRS